MYICTDKYFAQMKIKLILPALTEAKSPFWRPIKYSLFPPLGLATLAAYASSSDEVIIEDEHVETLHLEDEPDLVAIQVYITSAYRAYASPITTGCAARTSLSAVPTSPRCRRKPRGRPIPCSSGRARIRGRRSWPTSARAVRNGCTARGSVRWRACLPCAGTSSSGISTWCRTRSWFRAGAPTTATSATRMRSTRAESPFTPKPWMRRSRRLTGCRGATSNSWTTTSSATRVSPPRCSTA